MEESTGARADSDEPSLSDVDYGDDSTGMGEWNGVAVANAADLDVVDGDLWNIRDTSKEREQGWWLAVLETLFECW